MKRLQDKQGSYRLEQLSEEYKAKEKLLRSICEYPFSLRRDRQEPSAVRLHPTLGLRVRPCDHRLPRVRHWTSAGYTGAIKLCSTDCSSSR